MDDKSESKPTPKGERDGLFIRDGRFHVRIIFRDRQGVLHEIRKSTGTNDEVKAQAFRRKALDDIERELDDRLPKHRVLKRHEAPPTVEKYAPRYLEYAKKDKAPSSVRRDKDALVHLVAFFGDTHLDKLGQHVKHERLERYNEARLAEKAAPRTVNIEVKTLQRMCSVAVEEGILEASPLRGIKHLEESRRTIVLKAEELRAIIERAQPWVRWFLRAALCTGARRGEVLGLQWSDIDFENEELTIRPETSKTKRGRTIGIGPGLMKELRARRQPLNEELRVITLDGVNPPFRDSVSLAFKRIARSIGHPRLTVHDSRHWAVSTMNRLDVSPFEVAEIVGHATPETTARYSHLTASRRRDIARRLDEIVSGLFDETTREDLYPLLARLEALSPSDKAEIRRRLDSDAQEERL
jgi:integrase